MTDDLSIREFIERTKAAGASEETIVGMLMARGWAEKQAYEALAAHYERVTGMEIPRLGGAGTASKDTFFYLIIFSTLSTWIFAVGALAFLMIERWWPDPLAAAQDYQRSEYRWVLSWTVATMLVAYPVFLLVSRVVLRDEGQHPAKRQSPVRRWLTYMVLVVAAGIVIGDLISWLTYALRGELTLRVLAKGFVVLALSGGVFYYYFGGLKLSEEARIAGGWSRDRWMALVSAAVVLGMVTLGFSNSGTPRLQRELRADEKRLQGLYEASDRIFGQWGPTQKVPASLDELRGLTVADPETHAAYEYHPHNGSEYELCATFALSSDVDELVPAGSEWRHPAGRHCFVMDAARAPDGRIPFVMN